MLPGDTSRHGAQIAARRPAVIGPAPGWTRTLCDFAAGCCPLEWLVVNDGVMGGRSRGGFSIEADRLVFSGTPDTDGGGFCSIRTRAQELDMAPARRVMLRLRGDGRRYQLRLGTRDETAYFLEFRSHGGKDWQEVALPLEDFRARFRGRPLERPPLRGADVVSLGLMIYDGLDGPFRLELASLAAGA
jgi:monofunctional biosynthetic peptidoglycan transglycosylase